MRIISGKIKGKKLFEPKDSFTRPLKDLAKESIFNVINHSKKLNLEIKDAKVLDLFSGVGSFGIECLSRGSSFVTFVENYELALDILKKNILLCKFQDKSKIIISDIFKFNFLNLNKNTYNIIFLDPPFKQKINSLLEEILNQNLLSDNGIFIIHRHIKEKEVLTEKFEIIQEKNYGNSKIVFGKLLS